MARPYGSAIDNPGLSLYSKKSGTTYCDKSLWDYVTAHSIERAILSPCACHCLRMWLRLKKMESDQCSLMYVHSGGQNSGDVCDVWRGTQWERTHVHLRREVYGWVRVFRDKKERDACLARRTCTRTILARAHTYTRAYAHTCVYAHTHAHAHTHVRAHAHNFGDTFFTHYLPSTCTMDLVPYTTIKRMPAISGMQSIHIPVHRWEALIGVRGKAQADHNQPTM